MLLCQQHLLALFDQLDTLNKIFVSVALKHAPNASRLLVEQVALDGPVQCGSECSPIESSDSLGVLSSQRHVSKPNKSEHAKGRRTEKPKTHKILWGNKKAGVVRIRTGFCQMDR
jgi:hypothetical protein